MHVANRAERRKAYKKYLLRNKRWKISSVNWREFDKLFFGRYEDGSKKIQSKRNLQRNQKAGKENCKKRSPQSKNYDKKK